LEGFSLRRFALAEPSKENAIAASISSNLSDS
jgi:hypothetical protein